MTPTFTGGAGAGPSSIGTAGVVGVSVVAAASFSRAELWASLIALPPFSFFVSPSLPLMALAAFPVSLTVLDLASRESPERVSATGASEPSFVSRPTDLGEDRAARQVDRDGRDLDALLALLELEPALVGEGALAAGRVDLAAADDEFDFIAADLSGARIEQHDVVGAELLLEAALQGQ